jgi:hypothetical protein
MRFRPSARPFRRLIAALVLPFALAACVEGSGTGGAPSAVALGGGAVTIAGPAGFCVDSRESRDGAKGGFALMGSCASVSGQPSAARPPEAAILTASVAGPAGADFAARLPAIAQYLQTGPGHAALSRRGSAKSVTINSLSQAGGVLYLRATDTAPARGQSVTPAYDRAILEVKGRIVTLSVLALTSHPLSPEASRSILDAFVARVQGANR